MERFQQREKDVELHKEYNIVQALICMVPTFNVEFQIRPKKFIVLCGAEVGESDPLVWAEDLEVFREQNSSFFTSFYRLYMLTLEAQAKNYSLHSRTFLRSMLGAKNCRFRTNKKRKNKRRELTNDSILAFQGLRKTLKDVTVFEKYPLLSARQFYDNSFKFSIIKQHKYKGELREVIFF